MAQFIELRAPFFHQHGVHVLSVFRFVRSAIYRGAKEALGVAVIGQRFAVIRNGEDLSPFA